MFGSKIFDLVALVTASCSGKIRRHSGKMYMLVVVLCTSLAEIGKSKPLTKANVISSRNFIGKLAKFTSYVLCLDQRF